MIFKKYLQNKFTAISNEICTNTSLSTDARWCLWYLLTKPKDWEVRINDIRQVSGWGRDKVKSAINELIAAKYVVKRQERDGEGQFAINVYDVHEFPLTENPLPENPSTVDPVTANKSHTKDLKKPRTEKVINTEDNISADAEFAEFWAVYPKRPNNPKAPAIAKYVNARQKLGVSRETLLEAARNYAITMVGMDPRFIAQTQTWLNQRRWECDYVEPAPAEEHAVIDDATLDAVIAKYPGQPSNRLDAKIALAKELAKGVKLENIVEAAHKFQLHEKQMRYDERPISVPILETWIRFRWRDMDAYEFCRRGMGNKLSVRPKRGG